MEKSRYEEGLAVRKEVLGAEYVDKSLAQADDFTQVWQKYVTENCWGEVWTRPGLSYKTRSFLNLAMLVALNRPTELKTHIRGAFNNGVTKEELQEVLLQAAVYCGVPAAMEGFRIASEVIREMGK